MTINDIITNIRNIMYKGLASDDVAVDNRTIKKWIRLHRVLLLKQDLEKGKSAPAQVVQTLGCLELECVDKAECCQFGLVSGEYVKRTPLLPTPISYSTSLNKINTLFTYVGLVTGESIDLVTKEEAVQSRFLKYTGNSIRAYYELGRIYVINAQELEFIKVNGVFEDPETLASFNQCGSPDPCYSDDGPYPMTEYHVSLAIPMILKTYVQPIMHPSVKQDIINDSLDNPLKSNNA